MEQNYTTGDARDIDREETGTLISAERVHGTAVYDSTGDKIGSIDRVMIGKRSGKVAYAIMSFGGFLGLGEKYHPLPWDMLEYDTKVGGYRLPTTGNAFKDAPAFDHSAFDGESGGGSWQDDTDDYYDRNRSSMGARHDLAGAGGTGSGVGRL
ncbi:MAG: PRC-barrel domain-containing protein [Sphingomonadales bacterium]